MRAGTVRSQRDDSFASQQHVLLPRGLGRAAARARIARWEDWEKSPDCLRAAQHHLEAQLRSLRAQLGEKDASGWSRSRGARALAVTTPGTQNNGYTLVFAVHFWLYQLL